MTYDLRFVPFSRYGSYFAFSMMEPGGNYFQGTKNASELWLRTVSSAGERSLFRIELLEHGQPVPFETSASPSELILASASGVVRLCIPESEVIRVRAEGVSVRFAARTRNSAYQHNERQWVFNGHEHRQLVMFTSLHGKLSGNVVWGDPAIPGIHTTIFCSKNEMTFIPDDGDKIAEGALELFIGSWDQRRYAGSYRASAQKVEKEFNAFATRQLKVPDGLVEAAGLAAYVNWSSVVHPQGLFSRPAMLMSKRVMCRLWSWDHCFNAMALAEGMPELALEQFLLPFDLQLPSGQLPDSYSDTVTLYNFVKPPVHGWAFRKMRSSNRFFDKQVVQEVYPKLVKLTEFWLGRRMPHKKGLPEYFHGFESGWDNATLFDVGFPQICPDLSTLIIEQLDAISEFALMLGDKAAAEKWTRQADSMCRTLVRRLWDGRRFISQRSDNGVSSETSDSLLGCMPILLGRRLPQKIRDQLVLNIRRFLTPYGLATEHPASSHYQADGYWRGPSWAPSTMLIIDGLERCGHGELAGELRQRFCANAAVNGFAECYDALTGAGLRDRAYTWTSSIFLILAHDIQKCRKAE